MESNKNTLKSLNMYSYSFLSMLIFSTFELFSRFISSDGVDALQANFLRFLLGGIVIFVGLIYKKNFKLTKKEFFVSLIIGIVYISLSTSFTQLGFSYNNVSIGLLLIICSSPPIMVTLFEAMLGGKKLSFFEKIGIIIGFLGMLISFSDRISSVGSNLMPYLFVFIGNVIYALYIVVCSKYSKEMNPYKINAYSYLFGCIAIFVYLTIRGDKIQYSYLINPKMLYMGIVITGLSVFTLFKGIEIVGQAKSQSIFLLKPFVASVIIMIFLEREFPKQ